MQKSNITIFKRNEVARGTDMYSLNGKKCFNAIYYIYQKNRDMFAQYEDNNIAYMSLKFSTLRDIMGLQKDNNYVEVIKDAIRELQTTLIELNNWVNPANGKKYAWYSTKFLNDANVEHDNIITVQLEISTLFKQLMRAHINFTPLDLVQYMNKFRTKYAMKLYEYLKSFGNYRYLDIPQSHLMRLFGLAEDNKTYKDFSQLRRLLERQLKELIKKSDLKELKLDDSKQLKKDKIFRIYINPKAKKKTATKEDTKQILDSLSINRF